MSSLDHIQNRYKNPTTAGRYDDSRYNDWQGRLNNRTVWKKMQQALTGVPKGGRVLDIPCGTGRFSWHLAAAGFQTVACDISREMLDLARKAGAKGAAAPEFIEGDIFQLPFKDGTFDAVVCTRFMNLVERPVRIKAVRAMSRLAPVLVVSYYHPYTLKYASRWVRHKTGLRKKISPRISRAELLDEIKETGLHLRKLIHVAPFLSEEWLAVLESPK